MKKIKLLITSAFVFLLSFPVSAQQTKPKREFLFEGTKLTTYPEVEWLQGSPITTLDSTKIYIVEMWATWCVPCIQAMPHINALNEKFKDKNVVFIGQDVMENDRAKVEQFLKDRAQPITYRIAYGGVDGGEYAKKWLKPAAINSIPATFVIQNNKLVWRTHPYMLNDKVIQLLIDGKFTIEAAMVLADKEK